MSSLIERIGEACEGKEYWRVQDKDDRSFCIQFELWEEVEARKWWFENKNRDLCKNRELAKVRVFSQQDKLLQECAKMLRFFFGQMQMHSPKMDGQHSYTFRSGWPMTHCKGPNAEQAVQAAMAEVARSKDESNLPKLSDLMGLCEDSPIDVGGVWESKPEPAMIYKDGKFVAIPTDTLTTKIRKVADDDTK
jgi:hypothetical protein